MIEDGMNKRNYQKELDDTIEQITKENRIPTLLLHSCCAPCSSYVLEYLSKYFAITVLYYNPNIYPPDEYTYRLEEQKNLIQAMPFSNPVELVSDTYDSERFYELVRGLEDVPEGGIRCETCFRMRLQKTAEIAKEKKMDYFTTTLSISPLKNADTLNRIGEELAVEYKIPYLHSDFKKKDGYKRSIELSKEYHLYRQEYCGCIFSKQEMLRKKKN